MKILKSLLVCLILLSSNAIAETTVVPALESQKNLKSGAYNLISQDCTKSSCVTTTKNFKSSLRSIRVLSGRYTWIKRKIYFYTLRSGKARLGYFLLSSNCNMRSSTYVNLLNDNWRVGQYKYFRNSYTGRRLACKVQKIIVG